MISHICGSNLTFLLLYLPKKKKKKSYNSKVFTEFSHENNLDPSLNNDFVQSYLIQPKD